MSKVKSGEEATGMPAGVLDYEFSIADRCAIRWQVWLPNLPIIAEYWNQCPKRRGYTGIDIPVIFQPFLLCRAVVGTSSGSCQKSTLRALMILNDRVEKIRFLAFYLFLIVFVVRLSFFLVSDEGGRDAIARVAMARNISDHNMSLIVGVWQPLPFYLIAGALSLHDAPNTSPRFLSLIYGVLVVFPFFYLIKREFDTITAVLSILFFAFYITHIYLSIVSYAESLLLFLIISTLYYFFSYERNGGPHRHLLYAAILLALACMTRPEAWPLIGTICILLFWNGYRVGYDLKQNLYRVFQFGIIPIGVLSAWFLCNYMILEDPFYFNNFSAKSFEDHSNQFFLHSWGEVERQIDHLLYRSWHAFWQMGPILSFLIMIGLGIAVQRQHFGVFLSIPFTALAFLTFLTLSGLSQLQLRYNLVFTTLFMPIGAMAAVWILNRVKTNRQMVFGAAIVVLHLVFNMGVYAYAKDIPNRYTYIPFWLRGYEEFRLRYKVPDEIKELSARLRNMVDRKDKVLVDNSPFAAHVIVYADLDDLTQLNGGTEDFIKDVDVLYKNSQVYSSKKHDYLNKDQQERENEIYTYISIHKPKYVLYHKSGYLQSIFKFTWQYSTKTWRSITFDCLHQGGGYQIYQIKY